MAAPPIQFDRTSGVLEGANPWERLAAIALKVGRQGRFNALNANPARRLQ